jgi:chitinase
MKVEIKSSINESWNTGYGAILSIKNNSNKNYNNNWYIIINTNSSITWCDNLKITKNKDKIILEPQSYCPILDINTNLIVKYGGEGKMPNNFIFKEKSNPTTHTIQESDPTPKPSQNKLSKKVFGYFSEWSIYGRNFSVEQIPVNNLTHIVYAFMLPNPNQNDFNIFKKNNSSLILPYYPPPGKPEGSLIAHDEYANKINITKLKTLKKTNPNIKILISIGGWTLSWTFSKIMKDKTLRTNLISSSVDFIIKNGFDGIDIDWEFVGKQGIGFNYVDEKNDGPNFVIFLKELRDEMNKKSPSKYLEITAATGCDQIIINNYKGTEPFLDYILLMTYDFSGSWDNYAGNLSGIYYDPESKMNDQYNVKASVNNAKSIGYPNSKICIGVPLYGRGWMNVNPIDITKGIYGPCSGQANTLSGSSGEPGMSSWKDMRDIFKRSEWITGVNKNSFSAYAYNKNTKEGWTYETPETALQKSKFVVDNNLGGVLLWELSDDTRDGKENILNTLIQNFKI